MEEGGFYSANRRTDHRCSLGTKYRVFSEVRDLGDLPFPIHRLVVESFSN